MRAPVLVFTALLSVGCSLVYDPTHYLDDAGAPDGSFDCAGETNGTPCGDGRRCADGRCEVGACGDGVVDEAAGEECEDGNDLASDGCEPMLCTFSCTSNVDCDDAASCNGTETCDTTLHVCESGPPPDDRTPCGDGHFCLDQECVPVGCGNNDLEVGEECDDGRNGDDLDGCTDRCSFTCTLWPGSTNLLGLANGGFEAGSSYRAIAPAGGPDPSESGLYYGDLASLVAAESGITPRGGLRMLRFDATSASGSSTDSTSEARYALLIPSTFAAMIGTGHLRAHVSAHVNRVSAVGADAAFELSLFGFDAHPLVFGTDLARASVDLDSDPLLDSWECINTGFLVPIGTTMLVVEISANEDVENDADGQELDGHFADDLALWFSIDPCIEDEACVPGGDRCALGHRNCAGGGDVCEPDDDDVPDGTRCDVGSTCALGVCAPTPPPSVVTDSVSASGFIGLPEASLSADTCPEGQVLQGFDGYWQFGIGRAQAICGTMSLEDNGDGYNVRIAPGDTLSLHGVLGNTAGSTRCGPDELVVGLSGYGGDLVDQVSVHCATVTLAGDGSISFGHINPHSPLGAPGGSATPSVTCPAGSVADGANIFHGDGIDGIGLLCGTLRVE